MGNFIDLTGRRFGKLTVTNRLPNHVTSGGQTKVMYLCKCDCGNERIVQAGKLTSGVVTQCTDCHVAHFDDLTGQRFGMLTALERVGERRGRALWKCKCDCGNVVERTHDLLRHSKVEMPNCGCVNGRKIEDGHSFIHRMSSTRIYETYHRMISRCNNENHSDYKDYGGRGIAVCDDWQGNYGFINFYNWAIHSGYDEKLSIDRIDVNGNYCPENCRWADDITQANNKRNNHILFYDGKTQTIAEWAREYGISYTMLYQRIRRGWSVEDALLTPNLGRG